MNYDRFKLEITYRIGDTLCSSSGDDGVLHLTEEQNGNNICVTLSADREIELKSARLVMPFIYDESDRIFVNGYQSWTDTKEFLVSEHLRDVNRLPKMLVKKFAFDKYGDGYFRKYRHGVLHGYDVSYVTGKHELFVCSKNRKNAFLIISHDVQGGFLSLESDVEGLRLYGKTVIFDFLITEGHYREHLDEFLGEKKGVRKLIGYTSWYNHYQNINEEKVMSALSSIDGRFDLFQIDDGFETFVGDWNDIDPEKFPKGLAPTVDAIHSKGLLAGIWLAPFVAERKSRLVSEHPEWLLKDEKGSPVLCGSNWSGFYALDIYHPDAREYIASCLKKYVDMGFDFFKLDFLYAVCVITPKHKTRSAVAYEAYSFLREVLGDRLILGCGAHTTTAAGIFDYMRIGPDVSLEFDDVWFMRMMHRERISTKVTLQNTVWRSIFDGRIFGCDPDVFLLRDENIKLSPERRQALITLNALFGSLMMTSDDIGSYDRDKRRRLNDALELSKAARVEKYIRDGEKIIIFASVRGKPMKLIYNTETGVIESNG